ncbi:MAG: protein NrnU, partial [Betaproteobacteria bacterium]|nr:protein NrnU [Betaproteobacteria bacterium]
MTWLIAGLLIFLGVHSLRIFDEGLRSRLMHRWGEAPFKTAYSLLSVLGFGLLIYGYGQARLQPIPIYDLPTGLRHASILLVWFSMVLLIAAYVPGNWFKQRLRHPMVLGVKLWAFAHLLSNGTAADLLLFGSFLLWAIASFRAARQRDKAAAE